MIEITYKELTELAEGSYVLVDIRNEGSLKYGMIPNAISITHELFETDFEEPSLDILIQPGEQQKEADDFDVIMAE